MHHILSEHTYKLNQGLLANLQGPPVSLIDFESINSKILINKYQCI